MTSPVLANTYDVALLDLDGVVYIGPAPVSRAVESLREAAGIGMRLAYVTNNASRPPSVVAEHLRELGLTLDDSDVVTSAQAGARVLAEHLLPGATVLVVGGPGVDEAVSERGFRPVRRDSADDRVEAVIQGFGPDTDWHDLAEAFSHLRRGCLWVATNRDLTVPTARGLAPGNGSFVLMLETLLGRSPLTAGKPEPPLMWESVRRTSATRPLVVGDRLDTDIEGANRCGVDSLLVLTGVSGASEVLSAPAGLRPTYLAADLTGLVRPLEDDGLDPLREACRRTWARMDDGEPADVAGELAALGLS